MNLTVYENSISSIFPWINSQFRLLPSLNSAKCSWHSYVSIINILIIMNSTLGKVVFLAYSPGQVPNFACFLHLNLEFGKMFLTFIRIYYKCLDYHEFNIRKGSISSIFPWSSSQFRLLPSSKPWIRQNVPDINM